MIKLDISSTEIGAYKTKRSSLSLNLRTRLLVFCDTTFSFTGYLKTMKVWLTLPDLRKVRSKSMSTSVACSLSEGAMIHDLYLKFEIPTQKLNTSLAKLRLMFHISFTGQSYEKPIYLNKKAVIVPINMAYSWL